MKRWLVVVGLLVAAPLAAQEDSILATAAQLATEGQGDSARALVRQRIAALAPSDSLYPQALYVAGLVADDVTAAQNSFRRVSIEFPRSAWADRALLRLAQISFASGDAQSALRSSQRILTDYPLSSVLPEARFWAARALLELGSAVEGCRLLAEAQDTAGEDLELAHRISYQLQRCTGVLGAPDSTAVAAPPPPEQQPQPGRVVYSVQVAAVQTATAADEVMRTLHAAGYDPHVVRDTDGLFKVRVGRFAGRQDAQHLAGDVRSKLGGSPFVVEEQ